MANVKFEYNGKLSDGRLWDEDSKKKVTVELDDTDLTVPEMLEEFMNFMKAIGYNFELGDYLDVVNDFKTTAEVAPTPEPVPVTVAAAPAVAAVAVTTPTVSPTDNYTQQELIDEINRLKVMTMGVSDEAIEIAARNNLKYRNT